MNTHVHPDALLLDDKIDELLEDLMLQEYELAHMAED